MADREQDQAQQQDETKQQQQEKLRTAAKALKAQGFSNQQISQQLSAKHQMKASDIENILDQDDSKEDKA